MLKTNLRSLFLVLGVVILLVVSVGCSSSDGSSIDNMENSQGSVEQQELGTKIGELCARIQTNMTTANDGNIIFSAEPYIQAPALSWEYSLNVKIEDGKIYINSVLYEESSSTPPAVIYSDGFLSHADYTDKINNTEITSTLTKIKDCESCYLLETGQDSKAGQKISVYEIDNFLYFIRFFDDGEVMRIHYAPIA